MASKRLRAANAEESEGLAVDMSPMIDMVFLLLIFFIVTANLVVVKMDKRVEVPVAENSTPQEKKTGRIVINVYGDGVGEKGEVIERPDGARYSMGDQNFTPFADDDAAIFEFIKDSKRKHGGHPETSASHPGTPRSRVQTRPPYHPHCGRSGRRPSHLCQLRQLQRLQIINPLPWPDIKKRKPLDDDEPTLDISSLIDICFLLLIYFLVTTTIVRSETDTNMQLPAAAPSEDIPEIKPMFIRVDSERCDFHQLWSCPRTLSTEDPNSRKLPMLAERLGTYADGARAAGQEPLVQVYVDGDAQHQRAIDVIDTLRSKDITKVTFTDLVNE